MMTQPPTAGSAGSLQKPQRVVLVTGPSGAGRSTAIKVLEDIGFEAIDNLPLNLLPRLLDGPPLTRALALGIDPRNRDFAAGGFVGMVDELAGRPEISVEVLFLDCRPEVLLRRYSETRRRHPLSPGESPEIGITRETDMLRPIRARAGILIDTSDLSPHDLKSELHRWYSIEDETALAISVQSFSYKRGLPAGVDMVLDVRFLRNPHWDEVLRPLDGRAAAVAAYVAQDPLHDPFLTHLGELADLLLPAYLAEGKTHFALAFGCTGGRHRSVALAEKVAETLAGKGWRVSIRHRELERQAHDAGPQTQSG
jgi:RNase adapter protein RapZ